MCVFVSLSEVSLKKIHTILWVICKTHIDSGMTVDIAKTHISQQKFVHLLGVFVAPISVNITDSSERWATDEAYVKVNCDATSFIGDVGCCLLYTSPSPRDQRGSRMPSSA